MRFEPLPVPGAFLIEPDFIADDRGFFARTFCRAEFAAKGLNTNLVQCSVSFNKARHTLRGMHYQVTPHEEAKLVRCTKGAIQDVIVDLRPDSPAFRRWASVELSAENHRGVYIPEGVAHGFLTLDVDSEVFYQMSEFFQPECAAGARFDDAAFGIDWLAEPAVISGRDLGYPDFLK
ncbi:dTDP-4-dehydrorhamnose 3,5-epimerase family protein [Geomonas subterranea]|uniref:dTDP-4-dehydrorhamnose 3,5-epimerase family protein n=1 Tax=Geomonas subterranea TaxID=2847989 RepID=A0ABX8LHL7_9BACT|nr:dTDP-4-dehydrorhamnose 3,5-epimerase family protein [Geomonas subterranea]QXE91535.1 dTDP-4-dehydrorhamnose 3,5-epimerase family protein [Geomonas subterranea]QXM10376.1 dTDP-4-dehydrorhamnose 3,5-epimerase family protein [Geomonas subterranea]